MSEANTYEPSEHPVGEIVDRLDELAGASSVSLADVIDAFGSRSFLPVMMVPALLVVSPLSGIPFFSSACGLTIAFIAAQMVISRDQLWLPDFLTKRQVEGARARQAVAKLRSVAGWLDKHAKNRIGPFVTAPARKWVQIMCMLCGAAMPFLEIVPFSSSILGAAVLFLSTALLARDGLFVIFGLATLSTAIIVPLIVFDVI
ncbi:Uncharacterized conserved protein [Roseivivax halotolerans]|jgi:hypothetical protein|uniref:Uncharacterized conserved protein n=1 Tax=Roseivivax halotolerans TaxID=93684 RepID=A0A1I5XZY1_9RHOB|nr:exopolysaccharide biosynthesis protein [Roseivivax halotolerans]SFQ37495.1 Uncharacterized conserved protein [Roseivivax halotolerans]